MLKPADTMILIIDNYDSFTYNLYQQVGGLGFDVTIIKNDEKTLDEIVELGPEKIIISPGPGRPDDSGVSGQAVKHFHPTTPILGVCLGHQLIGELFGAKTVHAKRLVHGKREAVRHGGTSIFGGLPDPFLAARYNSLSLDRVPRGFELLAWSEVDREIMAMRHRDFPLYGVQFHPESFMTESGDTLMGAFLNA